MGEVNAKTVQQLRQQTGAGMMDCKAALQEAGGDMEAAVDILRKKGLKDLGKRAGKVAAEGTMGVYVHAGDQIIAVVELNCETDFVARGAEFKDLARNIAMHVAAMRPTYLNVEDVPVSVIEKEKEILLEQLEPEKRAKADKILPGKIEKYYTDNVLLRQAYVKDDSGSKTVQTLVEEHSSRCGEKVTIRRFVCMEVGEGIEKKAGNLAEEVAAMAS